MKIKQGSGKTKYGPGVQIELDDYEVELAISAYLVAHGVHMDGPRTVRVNGEMCGAGSVYVDPAGFVIFEGERLSGRG